MDYTQVGYWAVTPVSTGASTGALSVATVLRDHVRVGSSSGSSTEDTILGEKLLTAQRKVQTATRRPFFRDQFDLTIDRFPCDGSPIRLPWWPVVSVEQITSYGTTGGATVMSTDAYFVDTYSQPGRVCLQSGSVWPSGTRRQLGGVIRFTAGYSTGNLDAIPDPLVEAVRKLATELYETREAVLAESGVTAVELPLGYQEMLSDFLHVEVG